MTTLFWVLLSSVISYQIGRRIGIAHTLMRMQHLIEELQALQMIFSEKKNQWNEDQL